MAVLLIILKAMVHMVEGTLIKKYNSKYSEGGFLFTGIVSLFSMLFFVISDTNGINFTGGIVPYGILGGICYSSASIFTYIALGCGSFALTMLILSYSLMFSIVYGIVFLNDPVSAFTYIGIILMLISIYLIKSENSTESAKKAITPLWCAAIIISLFASGFLGILMKMQQVKFNDMYSNEFMIITLAFSAVSLIEIGLIKDRGNILYIMKNGGVYAALSGISNGVTNWLGLIVNMMMPISIVSPVSAGITNLITFLISLFIFKEKFNKKQIIGVIIATLALILFKI